jgi:hypothetical protein
MGTTNVLEEADHRTGGQWAEARRFRASADFVRGPVRVPQGWATLAVSGSGSSSRRIDSQEGAPAIVAGPAHRLAEHVSAKGWHIVNLINPFLLTRCRPDDQKRFDDIADSSALKRQQYSGAFQAQM